MLNEESLINKYYCSEFDKINDDVQTTQSNINVKTETNNIHVSDDSDVLSDVIWHSDSDDSDVEKQKIIASFKANELSVANLCKQHNNSVNTTKEVKFTTITADYTELTQKLAWTDSTEHTSFNTISTFSSTNDYFNKLRFDSHGNIVISDFNLDDYDYLFHHGQEHTLAGYTVEEILMYSASTVNSQSGLGLDLLRNILIQRYNFVKDIKVTKFWFNSDFINQRFTSEQVSDNEAYNSYLNKIKLVLFENYLFYSVRLHEKLLYLLFISSSVLLREKLVCILAELFGFSANRDVCSAVDFSQLSYFAINHQKVMAVVNQACTDNSSIQEKVISSYCEHDQDCVSTYQDFLLNNPQTHFIDSNYLIYHMTQRRSLLRHDEFANSIANETSLDYSRELFHYILNPDEFEKTDTSDNQLIDISAPNACRTNDPLCSLLLWKIESDDYPIVSSLLQNMQTSQDVDSSCSSLYLLTQLLLHSSFCATIVRAELNKKHNSNCLNHFIKQLSVELNNDYKSISKHVEQALCKLFEFVKAFIIMNNTFTSDFIDSTLLASVINQTCVLLINVTSVHRQLTEITLTLASLLCSVDGSNFLESLIILTEANSSTRIEFKQALSKVILSQFIINITLILPHCSTIASHVLTFWSKSLNYAIVNADTHDLMVYAICYNCDKLMGSIEECELHILMNSYVKKLLNQISSNESQIKQMTNLVTCDESLLFDILTLITQKASRYYTRFSSYSLIDTLASFCYYLLTLQTYSKPQQQFISKLTKLFSYELLSFISTYSSINGSNQLDFSLTDNYSALTSTVNLDAIGLLLLLHTITNANDNQHKSNVKVNCSSDWFYIYQFILQEHLSCNVIQLNTNHLMEAVKPFLVIISNVSIINYFISWYLTVNEACLKYKLQNITDLSDYVCNICLADLSKQENNLFTVCNQVSTNPGIFFTCNSLILDTLNLIVIADAKEKLYVGLNLLFLQIHSINYDKELFHQYLLAVLFFCKSINIVLGDYFVDYFKLILDKLTYNDPNKSIKTILRNQFLQADKRTQGILLDKIIPLCYNQNFVMQYEYVAYTIYVVFDVCSNQTQLTDDMLKTTALSYLNKKKSWLIDQ